MKLGDVASRIVVSLRKLSEYALNLDHPVGCDKALMFRPCLGFTQNNYDSLLEQISRKPEILKLFCSVVTSMGHTIAWIWKFREQSDSKKLFVQAGWWHLIAMKPDW